MSNPLKLDAREIYRNCLVEHPTLFDCPLSVSIHLFTCLGGGFEWTEDGKLESIGGGDYYLISVPHFYRESKDEINCPPYFKSLYTGYNLSDEADKIKYNFVLDNMERILDSGPTTSYFRPIYSYKQHYLTEGICYDPVPCKIFQMPNKIQQQWLEPTLEFAKWWRLHLRQTHMVGQTEDRSKWHWWPKDVLGAYEAINNLVKKLEAAANEKETQN